MHSEDCTSLGEEHELRELPADDEEGGGHGDGEQVQPGGSQAPRCHTDGKYLSKTEGKGKALSERRCPHHSGRLPVIVEEADDGKDAASEGAREEVA